MVETGVEHINVHEHVTLTVMVREGRSGDATESERTGGARATYGYLLKNRILVSFDLGLPSTLQPL